MLARPWVFKAALTLTLSRGERGPEWFPPPALRGGGPGWGAVACSRNLAIVLFSGTISPNPLGLAG